MADNLGSIPNNGAPNMNSGLWPMPDPACASEADGVVSPHWPTGATKGDAAPSTGGNDGAEPDSKVVG